MIRMTKCFALCALLALTATISMGQVVCSEDPVKGCVVNLPSPAFLWVASDGEAPFDPWGFGTDTSDGVSFFGSGASGWVPDTSYVGMNGQHWVPCPGCTSAPGTNTWILPANSEDLTGAWFTPNSSISSPELFLIKEPGGGYSDVITIFNNKSLGGVEAVFQSDTTSTIPEPTSLLLLGSGLLGAIGVARRRFIS